MGLIYYKGQSYGGASEANEVLNFYAVEGDPDTSNGAVELEKVEAGETTDGKKIWKVEIPMGTVIENAFVLGTDEIETHIKELDNHTRIQADIGTRLKFGGTPEEGIIAGGLRVAKTFGEIPQGTTRTQPHSNILNYIYSEIPYSSSIFYSEAATQYITDAVSDIPSNRVSGLLKLVYCQSGTSIAFKNVGTDGASLLTANNRLKMTGSTITSGFTADELLAFGIILKYATLIVHSDGSLYCCCYLYVASVNKDFTEIKTSPIFINRPLCCFIKISEDEARYAMGVTDSYEQMSFEDWKAAQSNG